MTWRGHDFDLTGITLDINQLDLTGTEFASGQLSLTNATFASGMVDLSGAQFSGGTVNFSGAQFSGGTVNFGDAQFSGGMVDFSAVSVWSVPPISLPPEAPGLLLPEAKATRDQSSAGPVDGDESGKDRTTGR